MKKEIFIRLDITGQWRGTDHRSSIQGLGDEVEYYQEQGANVYFEEGVSCYVFNPEGMAQLYSYWKDVASITEQDAQNMQVTIFEGDFIGFGTENEHIAKCTTTIAELPAIHIYKRWVKLEALYWADDETECTNVVDYIEKHLLELIPLF